MLVLQISLWSLENDQQNFTFWFCFEMLYAFPNTTINCGALCCFSNSNRYSKFPRLGKELMLQTVWQWLVFAVEFIIPEKMHILLLCFEIHKFAQYFVMPWISLYICSTDVVNYEPRQKLHFVLFVMPSLCAAALPQDFILNSSSLFCKISHKSSGCHHLWRLPLPGCHTQSLPWTRLVLGAYLKLKVFRAIS